MPRNLNAVTHQVLGSNPAETSRVVGDIIASVGTAATPIVPIDLKGAILAAGTVLGAYAGSTPGITLDNSKAVGVRWKGGTLTAIWTSLVVPCDLDPTYPVMFELNVSKSGATAADVASITFAVFAQTVGALEDAGSDIGGASGALTSAQAQLAAKTITTLRAQCYLPPTPPAVLSITVTPTGTLATDDLIINSCYMRYTPRPATPRVQIDLRAAILAAGTPMAAFANNAGASAPGVTLNNSKAVGIRWNNFATQTLIYTSFELPADMDITKPSVLCALVSKSGATVGDAVTLDIAVYEQVAGALEDATTSFGGTSSALVGNATAKTVSKLTRGIAANVFTAGPHRVTVSVKPTDGTLGTDDALLVGLWFEYSRKAPSTNPTPIAAIDFKAGVLATGTPMAAFGNQATSSPGVTLNNSKAVGIRWNNAAAQTAVWSERDLPLDFDYASSATLVCMVSKSGATAADASTMTVTMFQQQSGQLEDVGSATSNLAGYAYSGTTTAIASPTATAKTCSRLTMVIPSGTFTAPPSATAASGRLSISVKPTDGTLGTDDLLLCGCWIEYQSTSGIAVSAPSGGC